MRLPKVIPVFAALLSVAYSDYKCVCNYNVEKSVFSSPSTQGNVVGYMYEFDCKPQVGIPADNAWLQVAYGHELGYLNMDSELEVQTCQGAVPDEDTLTTTLASASTTDATIVDNITQTTTISTTSTSAMTSTEPTTVTQTSTTTSTTQVPTTRTMPTSTSTKSTIVSTQSTRVLPTSKFITTTKQAITPKPSILKGHVELCPHRIQQLAAQSQGEHLAQFGQNCYEVINSGVSWSHAETNCKKYGGHLIHIANQQEQDFIYDFLVKHHTHTVWLGLNDRNTEEKFEWTSGDNVTYENWKPGRKDFRDHNYEDCVFMTPTTGEWDDVECGGNNPLAEIIQGIRHAYICQYAVITPPNPVVDGDINLCSNRLHQQAHNDKGVLAQHDDSCYELVTNAKVSWQHAEEKCTSRGGHLVYITSAQEQMFVQNFMKSHYPDHAVWIGLTDSHTEGRFHWASGTHADYTNWVPGHSGNFVSSSQEDCVVFIPYKNGQWDDIPCGHTYHPIFGHTHSSGETHPLLCEYSISTGPSFIG